MKLPRSPPPKRPDKRESESRPNLTDAVTQPAASVVASQTPPGHANPAIQGSDVEVEDSGTDREVEGILNKQVAGEKNEAVKPTPKTHVRQEGMLTSQAEASGMSSNGIEDPDPNRNSTGADDIPEIRRLDSDAYKPWGSRSNNASPIQGAGHPPDQGAEQGGPKKHDLTVCKGGPGKSLCNNKVKDGEGGVECEKCGFWFHSKCQGLSKGAMTVLNKWHGTLVWLCDTCNKSLKDKQQPRTRIPEEQDFSRLEEKIKKLESIVRHNSSTLTDSIKNQEKMFTVQCKVLDKLETTSAENSQQQRTYAEALRGISTEVVKEITQKINKMPQTTVPVQRNREEIAGVLDEFHDKEKRKLNIIIHNLQEAEGHTQADKRKSDEVKFTGMIKNGLKLVVKCANYFRIGKKSEEKPRLLLVTLTNLEDKMNILRSAAILRSTTEWDNVYITPDLTWQEREKARALRQELARRRAAGEKFLYIRQGRIVLIPEEKRHQPARTASTYMTTHPTGSHPDERNLARNTTDVLSLTQTHQKDAPETVTTPPAGPSPTVPDSAEPNHL